MTPALAKFFQFISRYHLLTVEDAALQKQVLAQNIGRIRIAAILGAVLTLVHIVIFIFKIDYPTETLDQRWLYGIFWTHSMLFLCFGLILLFTSGKIQAKIGSKATNHVVVVFAYTSVLLFSNILSVFDQFVTSAINPFLLGTIAVSIIVLVPTIQALFAQLINGLIFILLCPVTQEDHAVLLSNNINAITAVLISAFIANNFWYEYVKRYNQKYLLEKQQSDLEMANTKLKAQTNQLESAINQRDKLFSLISHDLRSPFNTLIGSSELLINEDLELSDDEQLILKTNLLRTAQATYFLLENLLAWSQLQQDHMKLNPIPVMLNELVGGAINDCQHIAMAKNIRIVSEISADFILVADHFMLQTVLRNLIMNAVKFSYSNKMVNIKAVKLEDRSICISVIDNGVGMNEQQMKRLFGSKLPNETGTAGEKGMGIGLLLSNEFVSLHGGRIEVFSKPGKGSRFDVHVPVLKLPNQ